MANRYNEYGFDYNNEMYSIPEENRDFRKKIQQEIIDEELKTQNILGQRITDEADRTIGEVNGHTDVKAAEIENHITEKEILHYDKFDYVIENRSLADLKNAALEVIRNEENYGG